MFLNYRKSETDVYTDGTVSYKAFLKSDNIADDIPLVFEPAEGSRAH